MQEYLWIFVGVAMIIGWIVYQIYKEQIQTLIVIGAITSAFVGALFMIFALFVLGIEVLVKYGGSITILGVLMMLPGAIVITLVAALVSLWTHWGIQELKAWWIKNQSAITSHQSSVRGQSSM